MAEYQTIKLTEDTRGVARLILARPDKHNSIDATLIREMRVAAKRIATMSHIRAVVLEGEGKSFCAGGDLGWMRDQDGKDRAGKIEEAAELAGMLRELDELPKPVIARVHGNAYGGGLGMMSVCDVVVASDQAKFALTEVRLGIIPATIGPYVVRRIGEGASRRIFMNAREFGAEQAMTIGLVSRIAPAAELDAAIEDEVTSFLDCAPGAVATTKAFVRHLARNSGADHLMWTAERLADRWETEEAKQGIACFFAHARPPWRLPRL